MPEVWLRPNRRIHLAGMALGGLVGLGGASMSWFLAVRLSSVWLEVIAWGLAGFGILIIAVNLIEMFRPRIAYRDGEVAFYLRFGSPVHTPIEVVEAFFLGQGPAGLPARKMEDTEALNLIARLAERATEWQRVDVKPALGRWCDGYVTIRGMWCEPLTEDLARQINHKLAEKKCDLRGQKS